MQGLNTTCFQCKPTHRLVSVYRIRCSETESQVRLAHARALSICSAKARAKVSGRYPCGDSVTRPWRFTAFVDLLLQGRLNAGVADVDKREPLSHHFRVNRPAAWHNALAFLHSIPTLASLTLKDLEINISLQLSFLRPEYDWANTESQQVSGDL